MHSLTGISQQEAAARLRNEGANELPVADRRTPWKIILGVVIEPMFAFLVIAGAIYIVLGDIQESLVLVAFLTLSIVITVVQEIRSERVCGDTRWFRRFVFIQWVCAM